MSTERNWGAEPLRRPTIRPGDTLILDECGRVIHAGDGGVDYRSHWLCVVREEGGHYSLLVKHGAGEERISLGYAYRMASVIGGIAPLPSNTLYLTLYALYMAHSDARRATEDTYRSAHARGALKRKRIRGGGVRVWIEESTAIKEAA